MTQHKRGDSFIATGTIEATVNGQAVTDFTGWQGQCQLRSVTTDAIIADLNFEWLDQTAGLIRLRVVDTTRWPIDTAQTDIQLTTPSGEKVSTANARIDIVKDVTR